MAGLRQVFLGVLANNTNTGSLYAGPTFCSYDWESVPAVNDAVPWAVAGTFQHGAITLTAGPGTGKTLTYTLVKNGVDTALTFTIADLATTGSSSAAVTVAVGDLLYWRRTASASPAAAFTKASVEFVSTGAATSGYSVFHLPVSPSAVQRMPLLSPEAIGTAALGTSIHEVIAVAGTISTIRYQLTTAPGASKSIECVLYKNGVKQDGTGGTVDTRLTLADAATTGMWTGTLAVAAGDWLAIETTPTNTPTATFLSYGVQFVAATASRSIVSGNISLGVAASGTRFAPLHSETNWTSTEADVLVVVGPTGSAYVLRDLHIRVGANLSGTMTWTLRQNGANTALAVTLTATGGAAVGSNLSATVTVNPGDTLALQTTGAPSTTPIASFSLALVAEGPVELVTVPNVVGLTQAAADAALVAADLVTGTVTTAADPTVPAGSVIAQSLTPGASVAPGSAVDLVVSTGPAPDYTWQIENLTGATRWMTGLVVFAEGEAVALPPPPPGQPTASPTQVVIPMHVTTRVVLPSGVDAWGADCLCDE